MLASFLLHYTGVDEKCQYRVTFLSVSSCCRKKYAPQNSLSALNSGVTLFCRAGNDTAWSGSSRPKVLGRNLLCDSFKNSAVRGYSFFCVCVSTNAAAPVARIGTKRRSVFLLQPTGRELSRADRTWLTCGSVHPPFKEVFSRFVMVIASKFFRR